MHRNNRPLAEYIEEKIIEDKYSPEAALAAAAESGIEFLKRYCELEPSFEAVLKDEFSIEI